MSTERPTPEKMLARANEEELEKRRGKLKIYFGAAPGVGKTYTMLQDAQSKRLQGLDVVVGVVESHGRKEIEKLLEGLEILPEHSIEYHGKKISEFDLDGALKRDPALILIDEMAHTNAPGSRHAKRWQDIKEILDRGIDVYTTLNVQHIESLNDVIAQITRVHVRETVPDSMLELADTVELVDLAPDDLLKRLQEGKVYIPEQIELAKQNFFRKGNLASLRELALRITAERVDAQIMHYRQGLGIKHIWPTKERILVCVGHRQKSPKIIRAARRMATRLQAEWIAVYVETPKLGLSKEKREAAINNLRLAEQLGAETKILTGLDIVNAIVTFARERNVTKIVIGKQIRPRWKDWLFGSLVEELVRKSGEIDIYIIHGNEEATHQAKPITKKSKFPLKDYAISIGIVSIATAINFLLYSHVGMSNLIMIYLLSVAIIALFGKPGPSNLATALIVVAFYFFFLPPQFSFFNLNIQYFITLFVMFVVAQAISHFTILSRQQVKSVGFLENRTSALHTLTRQLAKTRGIDNLLKFAVRYISENFDSEVLVFVPDNGKLHIRARYQSTQLLNEKEQSIAQWVFDLGQIAGMGTNTLSSSEAIYLPLLGTQSSVGVLRVKPSDPIKLLAPEKFHFLEACTNQLALAIEADNLHEISIKTQLEAETTHIRNEMLKSITHDIRSPLTTIMDAAQQLIENNQALNAKSINTMASNIYQESENLNRLINNLLQITYLETHAIKIQKKYHSFQDVVDMALNNLQRSVKDRKIVLNIQADLPQIFFDTSLIKQVLENIIDNAIKFTSSTATIKISANIDKDKFIVRIEDNGSGISAEEITHLFDKFYRGEISTSQRGLGLGLALCQTIIHAHDGEIWVENCKEGGAMFCFTLPLV